MLCPEEIDLRNLTAKYGSDEWLYGPKLPFTASVEERFAWGGVEIQLDVNEGVIRAARVYTDAMDDTLAPTLESALCGIAYRAEALQSAIASVEHAEELLPLLETAL